MVRSHIGAAAKLTGCVAIVTGADSGIGRAVCIAYAREGADLVMSYLPEEQAQAESSTTRRPRARSSTSPRGSPLKRGPRVFG